MKIEGPNVDGLFGSLLVWIRIENFIFPVDENSFKIKKKLFVGVLLNAKY